VIGVSFLHGLYFCIPKHIDFFKYECYNQHIDFFECEVCVLDDKHLKNATIFKAFCDETRLMALSLLQSGEKCACELLAQVNVSQPTLSHHMKILVESGIVTSRKEGKWMYYSISQAGSEKAIALLKSLTTLEINQTNSDSKECCAWIRHVVPKTKIP